MRFPGTSTGKSGQLRTAKAALIRALEVTEKLLDGFPIPGAKGTIGTVLQIINDVERTATNAELCDKLRDHVLGLHDQLIRPLAGKTEEDIPRDTWAAVESFAERIERGLQRLKLSKLDEYGRFRRWLHSKEVEGDIRVVMDLIRLDTEAHMVGGIQRLELAQHQQMVRQNEMVQDGMRRERSSALDKLRRAPEAKIDSCVQPLDEDGKLLLCFKDTRTAITNKIIKWFNDPNSPPIFWLYGLAGTGKSTIARTIGVKAKESGYITASFFFSRVGNASQRDPTYMFPTLAHQLAASSSDLHRIIGDAVIQSPDIDHAGALNQFQTLIATPLSAFYTESQRADNILIILDAFDECHGVEDKRPQQILTCLRDHKYQAASRVRVFITSRPEHYLRHELVAQPRVVEHDLHLDDGSVQGDIIRFLTAKLPLIPHELGIPIEGWPREEDIHALSEKSGHLFIFANTALRFIGNPQVSDPRRQMNFLLGMDKSTINPYSPLDQLYLQVLKSALSRNLVGDEIFLRFRRVVGCIILAQDALPVSVIAKITDYSLDEVMATLRRVQSAILCSSPPGTVDRRDPDVLPRIYHPSFSDYLVNPNRCVDSDFTIIKPEIHGFIVLRCFELMKVALRRNILDLSKPSILNGWIPNLQEKVQSIITPEAAYACRFWISHLLESTMNEGILEALYEFLSQRFLWWCEALSLLDSAHGAWGHFLATAASTIQTLWGQMVKVSCNKELVDLLNDTFRFIFSHHQVISESAMHTYYTALPFTPHDTLLYHMYEREMTHSITVLQGLDHTWTSCLANLSSINGSFHTHTLNISLALAGTCLAVGDGSGVSLRDTRSTALRCHLRTMYSMCRLAFSPSENTLATIPLQAGLLQLWDTTTGAEQITRTLSGHCVYAASFSSGGQYLLLSIDQNLHLYQGTDANELSVLSTDRHHTSITFTSDDAQVISGSEEGQIHFFCLSGNVLSEIPDRRISNQSGVLGLVLNHNGQRLASSGKDGTIRIYELPSLAHIATLGNPDGRSDINSIAYHPMEEELAAGQDNTLVIWRQNETPGNWLPSIVGHHTSTITGVAYCENGTRIYTGSQDGNVKLWENTKTRVQQSPGHTDEVSCYAVDPPASFLATGSRDMTIILWNLTTGDYLRTLFDHRGAVLSLAFSYDSALLASGNEDRTIIVWDVASGNLLHVLGPHDGCGGILAFSEDSRHLTTRTPNDIIMWELESGEILERREPDPWIDKAQERPYYLLDFLDGWQMVVDSPSDNWIYLLCRLQGEYKVQSSFILEDRAVVLCKDGRVLILDISRANHEFNRSRKDRIISAP